MKKMVVCSGALLAIVMSFSAIPTNVIADEPAVPVITSQKSSVGTLNVSGTGKIKVKPDLATINVGVMTRDKEAASAQSKNNEIMAKVMEALKALGLKDEDIKTASFNMYPTYDYSKNTAELTGYEVTHMLNVTIKDIDNSGKYIDAAIKAGSNTSNSIYFSVSNAEDYYAQALVKAINDAGTKAKSMASALGITIGTPIQVSESGSYYPPAVNYTGSMKAMAQMDEAYAPMPVSVGELEISASVTATYQY